MKIEACVGTIFEASCEEFSKGGHSYEKQGTIACCGNFFRGDIFSKSVQLYGLWHGFQGSLWVGQFCVVSCFSCCKMYCGC
jgi:hypothetical protein